MNKSETIIIENLYRNIWNDLQILDINIDLDCWNLMLMSTEHNRKIKVVLFLFNSLNFDKDWYFNLKVVNRCLLNCLEQPFSVLIFLFDITKGKIYYSDLQSLARINFPVSIKWFSHIKLHSTFDLHKESTKMIIDHIIKYNYSWKFLYSEYKDYLLILGNIENHIKKNKKFKEYFYKKSVYIFETLNVVNSKLGFEVWLLKAKELEHDLIKLININIDLIKWLFKDEKKYWLSKDPDFYYFQRTIEKFSVI